MGRDARAHRPRLQVNVAICSAPLYSELDVSEKSSYESRPATKPDVSGRHSSGGRRWHYVYIMSRVERVVLAFLGRLRRLAAAAAQAIQNKVACHQA